MGDSRLEITRAERARAWEDLDSGPRPASPCIVRLDRISKSYEMGPVCIPVLREVSLSIAQGEMVAIMGASGSGKTTLINLIGGLDQPTSGRCLVGGFDLGRLSEPDRAWIRNERVGFVFQNFNLLPRLTALQNVLMPRMYAARLSSRRREREHAKALLERLGLGDRLHHLPSQLSGGQQQRVAIARALINRCELLIADEPTGNLDSRTGGEVLDVFRKLNEEEGLTVLLVTHDAWVASHADRVIRISDGQIEEGDGAGDREGQGHGSGNGNGNGTARAVRPSAGALASRRRSFRNPVHFLVRTIATALQCLRLNTLRSALTALGIIIGVAALIVISEIGRGSTTAIHQILTTMGCNNLLIQAGAASRNGVSLGSGSIKTLTPEDAEALVRECPNVVSAAPIVYSRQQVVHGSRNWVPLYLFGTTPGFLKVREWENLEAGSPFRESDVAEASLVCLLGTTIATELFGEEQAVGQEVLVNGVPLRVLGVLRPKGANIIGEDQDDILLAPWTTIKFRISGSGASTSSPPVIPADSLSRRYPRSRLDLYPSSSLSQRANMPQLQRLSNIDSILVRAPSTDLVPITLEQVKQLLRERHKIGPGQEDDFNVQEFTEVIRAVHATLGLITALLVGIALVALVVGGVGIMNIMLVSVTERYREIGLRMAVGAAARDLLRQFLIEATVLSLLGGILGIILGLGTVQLIGFLSGWPTEHSALALVASVGVSVTIGILFGYYPAWKASRMNPITIINYQ